MTANVPATVKVGACTYRVKMTRKLGEGLDGETLAKKALIRIHPVQHPDQQRDTLLHELLHATFWQSGLRHAMGIEDADEERLVRILTPNLLSLLRDNPDLLAYLTGDQP